MTAVGVVENDQSDKEEHHYREPNGQRNRRRFEAPCGTVTASAEETDADRDGQ